MLEQILLKIIHLSLLISLAALCSLSYPDPAGAESLWKNSKVRSSQMLFIDTKASRVGDIVTIIISETAKSKYENESENKKKSSVISSITNLLFPAAAPPASTDTLNANRKYTGSRAGQHNGMLPASKWSGDQNFKGEGSLDNVSTVEAKIAARVIAVLPNEQLLLEGKKSVKVGKEEQIFILSAIARQEDILANNTIKSEYLADARIIIDEKGPAAVSTKKGILTKVWEFIGLY